MRVCIYGWSIAEGPLNQAALYAEGSTSNSALVTALVNETNALPRGKLPATCAVAAPRTFVTFGYAKEAITLYDTGCNHLMTADGRVVLISTARWRADVSRMATTKVASLLR